MKKPNENAHFEWVRSATRASVEYDYVKLSVEEMDIAEQYIIDLLNNYSVGNERADMAEMLCVFASIYASSTPQEQLGILAGALNRSKDIHEELFKEETDKIKRVNDLINPKNPKNN